MSISATNGEKIHDDDSEEDIFMKKAENPRKSDEFSRMIYQKNGRNAKTTLYFMNQKNLENDGNGMKPDQRNDLLSSLQSAKLNLQNLVELKQTIETGTNLLLSQPFNDEINRLLPEQESRIETLLKEIESAKNLKIDERKMRHIQRKVDEMSSHWRKRKRLCIDFFNMMEDCTEGVMCAKKSLAGNGQIEIESDEMIMKQAKMMHSNRKKMKLGEKPHCRNKIVMRNRSEEPSNEVKPLASFVAVKLGPNNTVERVTLENVEKTSIAIMK